MVFVTAAYAIPVVEAQHRCWAVATAQACGSKGEGSYHKLNGTCSLSAAGSLLLLIAAAAVVVAEPNRRAMHAPSLPHLVGLGRVALC